MDMRRALNKRTIIVIVVILAVLLVAGGILVWRAASDTPGVHRGSQRKVR